MKSIIDAHAHGGIQDRNPPQSFRDYAERARGGGIGSVVMFPPVMEIYDRHDPGFEDNFRWQERRRRANRYLLTAGDEDFPVIPYFFIWNDFAVDQLSNDHQGIKWHRHPGEPVYHYDAPECANAIEVIRERNLPVVLEEELKNTLRFIREIAPGVRVIIPHLGLLNGGYDALKRHGIWEMENIYADTALASASDIADYLNRYGHERLLFGSDFPFGDPEEELEKVLQMNLPEDVQEGLVGGNLRRMLSGNRSGV